MDSTLNLVIDYKTKNYEKQKYLYDLQNIIINSNNILESCCHYSTNMIELYPTLYKKQQTLFWCAKQGISHICEIGFNGGNVTINCLLGNNTTPMHITIFDISYRTYNESCLEYLKSNFKNVTFEYIKGDFDVTINEFINNNNVIGIYDLIRLDAGYFSECTLNNIYDIDILLKINGCIFIDSKNIEDLNTYTNLYISTGNYIEILSDTSTFCYKIIKKIK